MRAVNVDITYNKESDEKPLTQLHKQVDQLFSRSKDLL